MAREIGFTQLGRRRSVLEKRESSRKSLLSILVINRDSATFRLENLAQLRTLLAAIDSLGEIIFIDNDRLPAHSETLVQDYPEVRVLIPTRKLAFRQCFLLGMREALSPHVLVLDASCYLAAMDLDSVFRVFADKRHFAVGFQLEDSEGNPLPSVVKAFVDQHRLYMIEGNRGFAAASLFLKDFVGIYDREKVLFLGSPDPAFRGIWAAIDFFFTAWGRGWLTAVEPSNRVQIGFPLPTLERPVSLMRRIAWARGELRFLKKYLRDRKQRPFHRRHLLWQGLGRLVHLDPALFSALGLELVCSLWPGKRRLRPADAVLAPEDIFNLLMEKNQ